ncbi:MAG: hypothetical protein ABIH53_03405 [archaeon]
MYRSRFCGLVYSSTNESLDAVITGLEPDKTDRILAVGGSGDQTFAMIEYGAKVVCVDNDTTQISYIQERKKLLSQGEYEQFYPLDYPSRNAETYFNKPGRKERIRENLNNLEIRPPEDFVEVARKEKGFTKLYLSNILGFHRTTSEYKEDHIFMAALEAMAKKLETGNTIYISNHGWLCTTFPQYDQFIKNTSLLEIDKDLTEKAMEYEKTTFEQKVWNPAVYRIK